MSNKDTKNIFDKALDKDQLENGAGGFKLQNGRDSVGFYIPSSITMSDEEQACIEKCKSTNVYKILKQKYTRHYDNRTEFDETACNREFLLLQGYKQEL